MPSTYTTNGGIELPANGEQASTWGTTVNDNMQIVDRLTNGIGAITLSGTAHTLTTSNGNLSDGQYSVLVLGGSPSGTNTVTVAPNDAQHVYIVKNASSQTATFTQGSGANVSVLSGTTKIIYCDGGGTNAAVVDITGSIDLGTLIVGGVTVTATGTELNILDGVTSTTAELNILDGVTSTTAELNILDGVTSTTAELNILDGVTATAAELNILHDVEANGLTVQTADLGTTAGDSIQSLSLRSDTTNTDQMLFTTERISTGVNWETAAHKMQRKVDTSVMGYMQFGSQSSDSITFGTTNTEIMRIAGSGNVGINASLPGQALHVNDPGSVSSGTIRMGADYHGYVQQYTNNLNIISNGDQAYRAALGTNNGSGNIVFQTASATTGNTERMRLDSSGRLGIGKTNPATPLDVNGTVTATAFAGNGSALTGISTGTTISGELFTGYVDADSYAPSGINTLPPGAFNALMAASALNTWMLTRFDYIFSSTFSNDVKQIRYQIRKGYRTFS